MRADQEPPSLTEVFPRGRPTAPPPMQKLRAFCNITGSDVAYHRHMPAITSGIGHRGYKVCGKPPEISVTI